MAGVKSLNPNIPWASLNIKVVTAAQPWKVSYTPIRRIGINAFGYGGTNAHAILEGAESCVPPSNLRHRKLRPETTHHGSRPTGARISEQVEVDDDRAHLMLLSAHDENTLQNLRVNQSKVHIGCSEDLMNVAYTLGLRRSKLPWRSFAIARHRSFETDVMNVPNQLFPPSEKVARPAFLFTGQGAQWVGMGVALMHSYPRTVRSKVRQLDEYLSQLVTPPAWTIEAVLHQSAETSPINEAEYSQPLCTAVQIVLVDLLNHWGITPLAAVGHSSGEIGAAYAAGRISAQRAIAAAYLRGKIAAHLTGDRAMLAIGIGASEAFQRYLNSSNALWDSDKVAVACHNSPASATLSGSADAIQALKLVLDRDGVFNRILRTDGKAYHSHHMNQVAREYEQQLHLLCREPGVDPRPRSRMFSTVWAAEMNEDSIPSSYWVENLVRPVLFEQGVSSMLHNIPKINLLIEIGPQPALSSPVRQTLQALNKAQDVDYLPTLKRGEHDGDQMLRIAGSIWAMDGRVDMDAVLGSTDVRMIDTDGSEIIKTQMASPLVDLPPYPWTYSAPCWSEPRASREHREMAQPRHDILGRRVLGASTIEPIWRNILRPKDVPWLSHHRLGGEVMLPGAGYLALAIEAITQLNDEKENPQLIESYTVRDVVFSSATVVPEDEAGTETLFQLKPMGAKNSTTNGHMWYDFSASCCAYGKWKEAARGKVGINVVNGRCQIQEPPQSRDTAWKKSKHIDWLDRLRDLGMDLGPSFTRIQDIYLSTTDHSARADLVVTKESGLLAAESRYLMHPTIIDSCMQPCTATLCCGNLDELRCGTIPTHIGEATFFIPSEEDLTSASQLSVWTAAPLRNRANVTHTLLKGHDGAVLLQMSDFRHVYYGAAVPHEMRGPRSQDLYLQEQWDVDAEYLDGYSVASFTDAVRILVHKHPQGGRVLCLEPALIPCLLGLSKWLTIDVPASSQEERDEMLRCVGENERVKFLCDDEHPAKLSGDNSTGECEYDLVVTLSHDDPDEDALENFLKLLAPDGHVIIKDGKALYTDSLVATLAGSFHVTSDDSVIVRKKSERQKSSCINSDEVEGSDISDVPRHKNQATKSALLIHRKLAASSPVHEELKPRLAHAGWEVRSHSLGDPDLVVGPGEQIILMEDDDAESRLLAHIEEKEMRSIIHLTETAPSIIWVTRGGLLTGDKPEYGMTTGAARVIRTEKGSGLNLVTVDYDESTSAGCASELVADVLDRQHASQGGKARAEKEYCIKNNVVYIPRLVSNNSVNAHFVQDSGITAQARQHHDPELAPAVHGRLDPTSSALSYHRDEHKLASQTLQPDELVVQVAAIGLTADDGADDTHFLSHQFAGTVVRGGTHAQEHFPLGSQVAGFASEFNGRLATFQHTSKGLVFPLSAGRQGPSRLEDVASIASALATAIYGLEELARVETGETITVVDRMGAVGSAAIQICRIIGAKVIVVTSSEATEQSLTDRGLINEACRVVLWSRDGNDGDECLRRLIHEELYGLEGGIDAVLCTTTVDESLVLENIGPFLSPLARIVVLGSPTMRAGYDSLLRSLPIYRGLNVYYFQLKDVARNRKPAMFRILRRCGEIYRSGLAEPFGPVNILAPDKALTSPVPENIGDGVNVVSYHENAVFRVTGPRTNSPLRFHPDASYLLVGCLGGLGRAVALRMAEIGAKHLVFLSRSGITSNQAAADTVASLEKQGVNVVVLRADITKLDDLERAVAEARSSKYALPPIRGVLNAAGVLHDGLFRNMTAEAWHEVANPKVIKCLNLHHVFSCAPPKAGQAPYTGENGSRLEPLRALDFFVITSSVASCLGSGGQSNYAAANAFLDVLARKRRAQGLPAVSLILPAILDIGWISEHQELERSIRGKGMYGIYGQEMLEAFEIAMRPQGNAEGGEHDVVGDHLIVGVQPRRFGAAVASAGAHPPWVDDARYSWLGTAVGQQGGNQDGASGIKGSRASQDIVTSIRGAPNREVAVAAATEHLATRLTRLLMLDKATLDTAQRSVGSYGLDSMIGAEFRNWLFREFRADIPFQQLLAGSLTIANLAGILCQSVLSNQPGQEVEA